MALDSTVRLWDVANRRHIAAFWNTSGVWSASFSPDRATLASALEEGSIALWNVSEWTRSAEQAIPQTLTKVSGDSQEGTASTLLDELTRLWQTQQKGLTTPPLRLLAGQDRSGVWTNYEDPHLLSDGSVLASKRGRRTALGFFSRPVGLVGPCQRPSRVGRPDTGRDPLHRPDDDLYWPDSTSVNQAVQDVLTQNHNGRFAPLTYQLTFERSRQKAVRDGDRAYGLPCATRPLLAILTAACCRSGGWRFFEPYGRRCANPPCLRLGRVACFSPGRPPISQMKGRNMTLIPSSPVLAALWRPRKKKAPMNQHQMIDQFKAEVRQILETRLERPIEVINTRLARVEERLNNIDDRIRSLDEKLKRIDDKLEQYDSHFHDVLAGQREILIDKLQGKS